MNIKEIKDKAINMGFSAAEVLDTDRIVFSFEFRRYCRDNLCGQYGMNYSCPPDCGTPEELYDRVKQYKKALVLQSSWKIHDFSNKEKLDSAKAWHNKSMLGLIAYLKENSHSGLMAGASRCNLCSACSKLDNKPCKHPDIQFSCLSAYCIDVKALAEECAMTYEYKNGILSFYGVYFFN